MNEQQEIIAKQNFHEAMLKLFKRTVKEIKYKPTRRLDLINKYGGYEAVIKMLPTDSNTFDFTLLWEQERLDLSIEAMVTKELYRDLFPQEVVDFCQKRLDEYNYAPKKLEAIPDDMDTFLNSLLLEDDGDKDKEVVMVATESLQDSCEQAVSQEKWHELLDNQAIFTASNKDLVLKIFALGERSITINELASLEGYNPTYPFYDVLVALCKRIKSALKLDIPISADGKTQWWQILFTGEEENKKTFVWLLRSEVRDAVNQLMEEGAIPLIEVPVFHRTIEEVAVVEEVANRFEEAEITTTQDSTIDSVESIEEEKQEAIEESKVEEKQEAIEESKIEEKQEAIEERKVEEKQEAIEESKVEEKQEAVPQDTKWEMLKTACIDYYGSVCELCGFDFGYTYGSSLEGFIHIHALKEIDNSNLEHINPQEDLIPICCNCETVMHHKNPPYTIKEMKKMLKENLS